MKVCAMVVSLRDAAPARFFTCARSCRACVTGAPCERLAEATISCSRANVWMARNAAVP